MRHDPPLLFFAPPVRNADAPPVPRIGENLRRNSSLPFSLPLLSKLNYRRGKKEKQQEVKMTVDNCKKIKGGKGKGKGKKRSFFSSGTMEFNKQGKKTRGGGEERS